MTISEILLLTSVSMFIVIAIVALKGETNHGNKP